MKSLFQSGHMRIMVALVMLIVIIALASYSQLNFARIQHLDDSPAVITVQGEGEVVAVPDVGQFSFSVTAEADDAATAQEQSGTQVNEILTYLTEQGVEEADVQTTNYNLYPRWRYEERICQAGSYCPPGERVQDGFEVSQSVSVKVRDTDQAGNLIAGVGERGATNISGLSFTVDDETALKQDARAQAIVDAQQKAVVLAEQLGVDIVRLASYSEGDMASPRFYAETQEMAMNDSGGGFEGPSLPPGEQTTRSQVTLQYEVR